MLGMSFMVGLPILVIVRGPPYLYGGRDCDMVITLVNKVARRY